MDQENVVVSGEGYELKKLGVCSGVGARVANDGHPD
jgi:hypothetical protein